MTHYKVILFGVYDHTETGPNMNYPETFCKTVFEQHHKRILKRLQSASPDILQILQDYADSKYKFFALM